MRSAKLGRFTEIGERVSFKDSALGDYSYIERHAEAIYATVGKFTCIAANASISALAHPIDEPPFGERADVRQADVRGNVHPRNDAVS